MTGDPILARGSVRRCLTGGKVAGTFGQAKVREAQDEWGQHLQQAGTVFALAQKQLEALHLKLAELHALCTGVLSGNCFIQRPLQEVQAATARTGRELDHVLATSANLQGLVQGLQMEAAVASTGPYIRENASLRHELEELKKVMLTMVPVHCIPLPEDDDWELESTRLSEHEPDVLGQCIKGKTMSCSSSFSCCIPVSLNDSSDLEWPEPLMDEFEMLSLLQGSPKPSSPPSWLRLTPPRSDRTNPSPRRPAPTVRGPACLHLLQGRWDDLLRPVELARLGLALGARGILDAALVEFVIDEAVPEDLLAYFLSATHNFKCLAQLARTNEKTSQAAGRCTSDLPVLRAYHCMVRPISSRFQRSPRLVVQFLRHLTTVCWHEQTDVKRAAFSVVQIIASSGGDELGELVAKSMLPFLDRLRSVQNRSFALDVLGHCTLGSGAFSALRNRVATALLEATRWPEERLCTRAGEIFRLVFQAHLDEAAEGMGVAAVPH